MLCSCNREEGICDPVPKEPGTPCGLNEDLLFAVCNQGPGFCKTVQYDSGVVGTCVGIPKIGAPCNDFNLCTKNDKCKAFKVQDGGFQGVCVGEFDASLPCQDIHVCTINDRCGCSSVTLVESIQVTVQLNQLR
jgi:hypothetical protein